MGDHGAVLGLLDLMLGKALVAALPAALASGGDLRAILPLLLGKSAKRGVAKLASAAFEEACHAGRGDIARLLCDVDGEAAAKHTAIAAARDAGHADVAALIAQPAEYVRVETGEVHWSIFGTRKDDGSPAVAVAAAAGNVERVQSLLEQRVDPNRVDFNNFNSTALHSVVSVREEHYEGRESFHHSKYMGNDADREHITALLLAADGMDVNKLSGGISNCEEYEVRTGRSATRRTCRACASL